MNLPNKLTVSRFVLTGAFLWAMFSRSPVNDTLALVFFVAAAITDYLDGEIARRHKLITSFGTLMDPLADKVMTCSAFIALIERHMLTPPPEVFKIGAMSFSAKVHAWMVVIIVTRELAITGLRLLAASKNVVLAAERYGKHKTISQMVTIIAVMVQMAYMQWGGAGKAIFGIEVFGKPWIGGFVGLAMWISVLLTFVSGSLYLWRNRQIYLSDM